MILLPNDSVIMFFSLPSIIAHHLGAVEQKPLTSLITYINLCVAIKKITNHLLYFKTINRRVKQ